MACIINEQTNSVATNVLVEEDEDPVVKEYKEGLSEFLKFRPEEQKLDNEENNTAAPKPMGKRKRKPEDDISLNMLTEVFLRIVYPISRCMTKTIAIGLVKPLEYSPNVILTHATKKLVFSENAWESFMKHLHLIECYLGNNMFGRKTALRLLESDIEIDVVKHRGDQQIRIRDLTKHDEKILLSREEFYMLGCAASPVTRYMKQLIFSYSVVKDYLVEAMENHPNIQILHGPIDTSIFNRLPHEVEMWRLVNEYGTSKESNEENQTENQTNIENNEEVLTEEINQ